jgi:diadenosine tetraphosphatase ApaH/serine/threonine PP2A family protein phosphatase
VVADLHGCLAELESMLRRLGYVRVLPGQGWRHPHGRRLVVAGDMVDRGPAIPGVLRLVMAMVRAGDAIAVVGNHDDKLLRALEGRRVSVSQGLGASLDQLTGETPEFRRTVHRFLASLPSHAILDDGRLVVAHAGLPEHLHGSGSRAARDVAMYGITKPGKDPWGQPIRVDWAADYAGDAFVVYGHTPIVQPVWRNRTIDIDTGCVFGGALTAVRYPEMEVVSVPALRVHRAKGSPWRQVGPGGPVADEEELERIVG